MAEKMGYGKAVRLSMLKTPTKTDTHLVLEGCPEACYLLSLY